MTDIILNPTFEKIVNLCQEYAKDESFVYKSCHNVRENINYLVIMQKDEFTRTNELRTDVLNPEYAKFRASCLKVIEIININNPDEKMSSITNQFYSVPIIYKKGDFAYPNYFDENLNEICSNGIHYFKTIIPALFYMDAPKDYTGTWYVWNDNGGKKECDNYLNGILHGKSTGWYYDGEKKSEGNMVNGEKHGEWVTWYNDGIEETRGKYNNGKTVGLWTCYNAETGKSYQYHSGVYTNIDGLTFSISRRNLAKGCAVIASCLLALCITIARRK